MHRKALVDSDGAEAAEALRLWPDGQSCADRPKPKGFGYVCVTPRYPAFGRVRDCRKLTLPIFLLAATLLNAAPDPDIFDGRIVQQQGGGDPASGSGGGAGASEGSGDPDSAAAESSTSQSAASGGSGSSGRDFSEIGQVGSGQEVSSSGATNGGGESTEPAGGGETGNPSTGSSGSGSATGSSGGSDSSGGSASGSEPRDFSEIGGISGTASQGVEVNSSKASSSPLSGEASTATSGASTNQSQGQGTGGSGSQPSTGSGSGDYGDTLPSGI
jgi:hypothetical protein